MAHSGAPMGKATAQGSPDSAAPRDLLRDLARQSMALCFTDKRRISTSQRIDGLRDIQRLTQHISSQLVLGGDAHVSEEESTHGDDDMRMAAARLAPPRAYFLFRENGRMRLPRVDWGAFRGYSMAFWINVRFTSAAASPRRRRGSSSGIIQGEGTPGKAGSSAIFHLYRFTNASNTLGEEAWLEYAVDTREGGAAIGARSVILHVRSCSPNNSDPKKSTKSSSAAIAHAAGTTGGVSNPSEWRHIQQRVDVLPGQWHLLVLSHSLHYVKKSEVTCFVDGKLQGRQELVYPSGLVTASKCSVGGGQFTSAKLASVTMYHDEVSKDTVAMLYAQGPTLSSFHRTSSSSPSAAPPFAGFEDTTVNSPLSIPFLSDLVAAVAKLQIVFCFTAHDMANAEEYADVGVEWLSEGTPSGNGKWTTMESTAANSAEIQQRHAKLDKQVHKVSFVDAHAAWYRSFGVTALPSLLHYILSAYEKIPTLDMTVESNDDTGGTIERIVIDLLWILKGLLLNNPVNQQRVLQQYVLHMLAHVMIQHPTCLPVIWTPRSMLACVDVVRSLFSMVPSRKSGLQNINHPLQESIWSTNPLFASGIRALLLDFRLWTSTSYKTQSIYTHQLYGLVCEYPRAFNEMQIVPKVLEILRVFYAPSSAKTANREQPSGSQNSKHTSEQDQHWKQQCVQTLMDVIEICITNQSVLVHEVLEQELLDTTFAHSVHAPIATPGTVTTQLGSTNSASVPPVSSTPAAPLASSSSSDSPLPARQGGVFRVNLENIVWSDQTPASVNLSDDKNKSPPRSVLPAIQVRFSLVRDMRAILRFLVTSGDAVVSTSILIMLRRLAVSFLDMRFALVSSNMVDCLLFLMRQPPSPTQSTAGSAPPAGEIKTESTNGAMRIRMACVPLFIYLLDWLESVEGRTVWCGLEEHLRLILNGEGSFSIGFLELMMEFYFDPTWCLGVQQGIIMNDPSKKESFLFPISSASALLTRSLSFHESGILVATDDGLLSAGALGVNGDVAGLGAGGASTSSINGLHAWIKMASQFVGKRLALSWEKRVAVIQRTAIRNLTLASSSSPLPAVSKQDDSDQGTILTVAELFDDGVTGILNLPLRGMLPFLPSLLGKSSPHFREKVLMDINVKLKTDEELQQQLLLMKRGWAESLLELSLACAHSTDEDDGSNEQADAESTQRGRAYSFDAKHTGEDLVLDTVVSLLCTAMGNVRGWRSFTDLISALKIIRLKYDAVVRGSTASPPTLLPVYIANSELYCRTLDWLSRVAGIVLQRMSRTRTILSRVLAENVQKVLYLVLETLLALPLKATARSLPAASSASSLQKMGSGCVLSEAQLFLLNAVLDMNSRLIASTHQLHRIGLVPGLQILLRSLPYVSSQEMMERTVVVLVAAFQQEMSSIAGIRIYETVPTRDIFLSALVCLRRSLLVQDDESLLGSLRVLTLRTSTSGLFTEELQAAGLTVQYLSDATEEEAVLAVLDALALAINDAEMHEREEEADLVPYFPIAKELRYLNRHQLQQDGESSKLLHQTSSGMSDSAGDGSSDVNEDVLWAALEVEENRMMETVRNVAGRETQRMTVGKDAVAVHKKEWSTRLWVKQEITFRSQYQHHAFAFEDPGTLQALQNSLIYRLGRYETPQPGRVRRSLAIDLDSLSAKPGDAKGADSAPSRVRETRRRQLSLSLELLHGIEGSDTPHSTVNSEDSELLLERVGRVVAEQRGGEIQDITSDCDQSERNQAALGEDQRPSTDNSDEGAPMEQIIEDQVAITDEEKRVDRENSTRVLPSAMSAVSASQTSWHLDMERYYEKGLDPGEGIAIFPQDQVLATAICRRVIPEGMVYGDLFFCNKHLVFEPHQSRSMSLDPAVGPSSDSSNSADEAAPGLHRCWRWKYRHIAAVYLRRYRLRDSALEIFLRDGSNHFLDFPHAVKQQRNELVRFLYSFLPRNIPKQWPGRGLPLLGPVTKAWQTRQISNFEYLMALNTFAGRSFNDLTQYPVFPWVLSNYESETLDLSDPHNFRDLSKPMGALNATRLEEYWERYHSFDDPVIPKFLYGSHYSTCAGVVLFFLFRLQPFAELHKKMQGNGFDLPDRLFSSIQETWRMCNSQMSEVKELTPEFYCNANFLKNLNHFALGKRHDQREVNDVQLPPWAKTPEEFVTLHRAALESELVSQHLHEWVDLIFGFKQRGKAALKANNVFYYLTYYGVVDLDLVEDPFLKESMELQIAHFGQCPMQLFGTPHPKRNAPIPVKRTQVGTGGMNMPSPNLGVPNASAVTSPGPNSVSTASSTPSSNSNSASNTNIARPLSLAFRDPSLIAQERRRQWSPALEVKPLVRSTIRLIKIFPDRFLSVSELGVIEMYHWKLVPKPQPSPPQSGRLSESELAANGPQDVIDHQTPAVKLEIYDKESSVKRPVGIDPMKTADSDLESTTTGPKMSPAMSSWLLEAVRDDTPFDFVPRVPVFEEPLDQAELDARSARSPLAISLNGRLLMSGGARNGALHLRLLDLDNGHVIGKASVIGHDDAVTCFSVDKWTYNAPPGSQDEEELLLSGSKDGSLAVWRLSHIKQDLLFRLPRVSSSPLLVLRGHMGAVVDCNVSTYLGVAASCSKHHGIVHFLHEDGQVAFTFAPAKPSLSTVTIRSHLSHVRVSIKGFVLAVTRSIIASRLASTDSETTEKRETEVISCTYQVFNLSGVLVHEQEFDTGDDILDVQLSAEGDLIIWTLSPGTIRICRLEEYVAVLTFICMDFGMLISVVCRC